MPVTYDYLRDPGEITRRSFELVRAETDLSALPPDLAGVAVRLVHACGLPEIVGRLVWGGQVARAARFQVIRIVQSDEEHLTNLNNECIMIPGISQKRSRS